MIIVDLKSELDKIKTFTPKVADYLNGLINRYNSIVALLPSFKPDADKSITELNDLLTGVNDSWGKFNFDVFMAISKGAEHNKLLTAKEYMIERLQSKKPGYIRIVIDKECLVPEKDKPSDDLDVHIKSKADLDAIDAKTMS